MGPVEGMKIVEARKDMDAVFVGKDNKVHISSGLQGKVNVLKQPSAGP